MGAGAYRIPWIWNYRQSWAALPGYRDSNWDHLQGSQVLLTTRSLLELHKYAFHAYSKWLCDKDCPEHLSDKPFARQQSRFPRGSPGVYHTLQSFWEHPTSCKGPLWAWLNSCSSQTPPSDPDQSQKAVLQDRVNTGWKVDVPAAVFIQAQEGELSQPEQREFLARAGF